MLCAESRICKRNWLQKLVHVLRIENQQMQFKDYCNKIVEESWIIIQIFEIFYRERVRSDSKMYSKIMREKSLS